jgi:hypothetical protein
MVRLRLLEKSAPSLVLGVSNTFTSHSLFFSRLTNGNFCLAFPPMIDGNVFFLSTVCTIAVEAYWGHI